MTQEEAKKVKKPRRKFKALDIVFASGVYWIVGADERDDGSVVVGMTGSIRRYKYKDLKLVCAAENREDRSAAAEGSGVTRKGVGYDR